MTESSRTQNVGATGLSKGAYQSSLTPRAARCLKRAGAIAAQHGHGYVGTEHLLLAILADEGGLSGYAVRKTATRATLEEALLESIAEQKLVGQKE